MMMLKLRNLESGYGNLKVLKGISLHISKGEIVTIIGANGAGKTTLLNTITGLIKSRCGEIYLSGNKIENIKAEGIVHLGCSLVPEGRQIFDTMTVKENLLLGAYILNKSKDKKNIINELDKIFDIFPKLLERKNQLGGTLSGGEQ
jgi:branched-chain amino acid transport system ATP-binding protein